MLSRCLPGTSSYCVSTKEVLEIEVKSSQLHSHLTVAFQSHSIHGTHEGGCQGSPPLLRKVHGFSGLDTNFVYLFYRMMNDSIH